MAYLTYSEYQQMGGSLSETAFAPLALRAAKLIDAITHRRAAQETPVREAIRRAAFAVIALMREDESYAGRDLLSMANDGVSASFSASGSALNARCARIVREYLAGETTPDGCPLVYAGVDA